MLTDLTWKLRFWRDRRGQDLIEYALLAGFLAVAVGALMPGVGQMICQIFSKVANGTSKAATQGS